MQGTGRRMGPLVGEEHRVVGERQEQVLPDIPHRRAAEAPRARDAAQIPLHEGDPRALHRDVRAGAHRDAHVGLRERGRVVDAVAGEEDALPGRLEARHDPALLHGRRLGRRLEPERLESLKIGCVGMTRRFFPDGRLTATAFADADTMAAARRLPSSRAALPKRRWTSFRAPSVRGVSYIPPAMALPQHIGEPVQMSALPCPIHAFKGDEFCLAQFPYSFLVFVYRPVVLVQRG